MKLKIGNVVEQLVEWISLKGEPFFDALSIGIEGVVNALEAILLFLPPIVFMIILALLTLVLRVGSIRIYKKNVWKKGSGLFLFTLFGLALLLAMGYWQKTMETLALVISSSLISIIIGLPLGIQMSRSNKFESLLRPVLDFMQTMPAFVYLIPAILFFSVGNVPGVMSTVIFSLPPVVRLTNLGIRNVDASVLEAAHAFGSTDRNILFNVQIPLALPTILAGINQVIMLALSMVVIASMVGAGGLGQLVYRGILQADIGLGFEAGLGIVIIAIILDRTTQSLGSISKRRREHT